MLIHTFIDDYITQLLLEAKQQGATMKVRHAKILFCGASGAGKTSFSRLLKNVPLDEKRNSTGVGESQQIMISEKATMKNNEWSELSPAEEINQLKLRLKHGKLTKISQAQVITDQPDDILTGGTQMASTSLLQHRVGIPGIKSSYSSVVPKRVPEVEKCLASNFYNADKQESDSTELHEIWDILTLLDTGGQPEFINMLPAVNSSATITFVVLNMAGEGNILEERVQVHHFKNGIRSYEPYPLNYTNEDLIKCLVALLKDSIVRDVHLPIEIISKEATDHKPGLCFVGTHLDKVNQDTVDSIREKLDKIVDRLEPNDKIEIFSLGAMLLFAVNNTIAGKDLSQDSITSKIRLRVKKMIEEKAVYEVPIVWILLELEIRRICDKQKRSFLPIADVLPIYDNISDHQGTADIELEVKAALQFHHKFGVLLYFHDVPGMNEYVIANPQWLFANLTNLVCCSFDNKIVDRSDIKRFKSEGILSGELIKEINTDSLGGIDIEHFFMLLQYLKIVTPFPKPESSDYLMLCVLDSFKSENSDILHSLLSPQSVPLLMQFKSGTLPRGIFCCLVVQLIWCKYKDWKLQLTFKDESCIYGNFVVFCIQNSIHYLVLFDRVSHLEIHLGPTSVEDDCKLIYLEVQQCITEALKIVCSCELNDIQYGFYCKQCLKAVMTLTSEHMTGEKSFPKYLHCEKHGSVDIKSHNLWSSIKGNLHNLLYTEGCFHSLMFKCFALGIKYKISLLEIILHQKSCTIT